MRRSRRQLGDDQAQPERLILVTQPIITFDEDDLAVPSQGEPLLVEAQQRIVAGRGIL